MGKGCLDPSLYNDTGEMIEDDIGSDPNFLYIIPPGETVTVYAGTNKNTTASYYIHAAFTAPVILSENTTITLNINPGARGKVPVQITAPEEGGVFLETSAMSNGTPAMFDKTGKSISNSSKCRYTVPAGESETLFFGTHNCESASYALSVIFPGSTQIVNVTPGFSSKVLSISSGESGSRIPITVTAPDNQYVYLESSGLTMGSESALFNEAGEIITVDTRDYFWQDRDYFWHVIFPGETKTVYAGTANEHGARYTISAAFMSPLILTEDEPEAKVLYTTERTPIIIRPPLIGNVYLESWASSSSLNFRTADGALFHWSGNKSQVYSYALPTGETTVLFAATGNHTAQYSVKAVYLDAPDLTPITLTESNWITSVYIGNGERLPITVTAPPDKCVYVMSTDVIAGSAPKLYDEAGKTFDASKDDSHFWYVVSPGETVTTYAGTSNNNWGKYTVSARYVTPLTTLNASNPVIRIAINNGINERIPLTVTAPPDKTLQLRSSTGHIFMDPTLYGNKGNRLHYSDHNNYINYFIPAGKTVTFFAGENRNREANYTLTAFFPPQPITLTAENPSAAVAIDVGKENWLPVTITAPPDGDVELRGSDWTINNAGYANLYDSNGERISSFYSQYNIPAGETVTVYVGAPLYICSFTLTAHFPVTPTVTPTPTATPTLSNIESFVTRIYENVLEREPDKDGFDFWVNGLASGHETASSIIYLFFFSEEFLDREVTDAHFIEIAYLTFMGRTPEEAGMTFWMNTLEDGKSRRYVVDQMLRSEEFKDICKEYEIEQGPVEGVGGFVARMYRNVLGRGYDLDGLNGFVSDLNAGTKDGASLVETFFFSNEFLMRNVSNVDFINIAYNTLLNREPDEEGQTFWLDAMAPYASNLASFRYVLNEMTNSDEFKAICQDYGINPGQFIKEAVPAPAEIIEPVTIAEPEEIFVPVDITEPE